MDTPPLNQPLFRPPRPRIPVWQRKLGVPEHSLPSNQTAMGLFNRAAQISADLQKPYQRPERPNQNGPIRPSVPVEAANKPVPLPIVKKELLEMISFAQEKLRREREAILKKMHPGKMLEKNDGSLLGKQENLPVGRGGVVKNSEGPDLGRGRGVIQDSGKGGLMVNVPNNAPGRMPSIGGQHSISANSELEVIPKPLGGMNSQGGYGDQRSHGPDGKLSGIDNPARYSSLTNDMNELDDHRQIETVGALGRSPRFEGPRPVGHRHMGGPADAPRPNNRSYGTSTSPLPELGYSRMPGDMAVACSSMQGTKGPGDHRNLQQPAGDWQRPHGWSQVDRPTSGPVYGDWNSWGSCQQYGYGGGYGTVGETHFQQYNQMSSSYSQYHNSPSYSPHTQEFDYSYMHGSHYC